MESLRQNPMNLLLELNMLLNLLKTFGHILIILALLAPCAVMPAFTWSGPINFLSFLVSMALATPYTFWAFGDKLGIRWEHINF